MTSQVRAHLYREYIDGRISRARYFHMLEDDEDCRCRFVGDWADASDCPLHNTPRDPAVKLDGCGEGYERCPF
jgi:hypothetical protein